MTAPLNLVAVSAGMGQPSTTRLLADRLHLATERLLEQHGRTVETRHIELRDLVAEIGHHLVTGFPGPALREAKEVVGGADGLIAVTPVYTGSYSGLFKSFFDVLEPTALSGTPVLIAATGGTARHSLALDHAMRPLFSYLRALVVPTAVYAASEDWGSSGDAQTDGLAERTERAAGELVGLLDHLPAPAAGGASAPRIGSSDGAGIAGTGDAGRATPEADGTGGDGDGEPEVVPFAEQLAAVRKSTR